MQERFRLDGQVALVTGASSGMGRHFAQTLSAAGAQVVVGARRLARVAALADEITGAGGVALAVELDVTSAASIAAAFAAAEAELGVVQVLVNNAGVSRTELLLDATEEAWDLTMDTNLKAVWQVGQAAAQRLQAAGLPGSVINIASVLATGTSKMLGAYMASKAGVVQLTKAMALEWAPLAIRANAILPGYFPTEMTGDFLSTAAGQAVLAGVPQRRAGELDELSGPLLLLATAAGAYMTGATLEVDGGLLCRSF